MSTNKRTLVFVGAHPDDESFGPGAVLAKYAAAGYNVYVICATGGEAGTVEDKYLKKYDSMKSLREAELDCAAKKLGLTGLYRLGYRDSNMRGSPDNDNPECMNMAPVEEAAGRIVKIFREIKPDVVITHDEGGNYGHPDHVASNKATKEAFFASGDPERYPEAGEPFQPSKLYYMVNPHTLMRWAVRLMPLFGQDPSHFGRNGDIDLRNMLKTEYPYHAVVKLGKQELEAQGKASACHASQLGGGGRRQSGVFRIIGFIERMRTPRTHFLKAYPKPGRLKEKDLFQGLD